MFERIISFFSENIFFLFVIIGIISSLFGKEKKDASKQKRPEFDPIPKPTAQPVQKRKVKEIKQVLEDVNPKKIKEIKHVLEDLNPKKVKEIVSSAQVKAKEIENEVSDTYQELLKQQERWEQEAAALEAKANSMKQANHVAIYSDVGLNAFHKNELVNGIIMSEVLGPPKSKQPFNRLKK
ncbi:hypothetical protein [Bacillus sp. JJ722]|uniref:hypothetical protein n=1 Tax=Bacillus sp. JJ722 TaxID=3122973 RepID=UPI002FFEA2F7